MNLPSMSASETELHRVWYGATTALERYYNGLRKKVEMINIVFCNVKITGVEITGAIFFRILHKHVHGGVNEHTTICLTVH